MEFRRGLDWVLSCAATGPVDACWALAVPAKRTSIREAKAVFFVIVVGVTVRTYARTGPAMSSTVTEFNAKKCDTVRNY